ETGGYQRSPPATKPFTGGGGAVGVAVAVGMAVAVGGGMAVAVVVAVPVGVMLGVAVSVAVVVAVAVGVLVAVAVDVGVAVAGGVGVGGAPNAVPLKLTVWNAVLPSSVTVSFPVSVVPAGLLSVVGLNVTDT